MRKHWPSLLAVMVGFLVGRMQVAGFLATAAGQASQADPPRADQAADDLHVRCAQARLKLAQLDLQKVLELNKRSPGVVPEAAVEPLEQAVAISEAQLEAARRGKGASLREVFVCRAEAALKAAKAKAAAIEALRAKEGAGLGSAEVERARLGVEVARSDLARARAASEQPTLEEVQWNLLDIYTDVLKLRSQVATLSMR
jgi:hypothetical protein